MRFIVVAAYCLDGLHIRLVLAVQTLLRSLVFVEVFILQLLLHLFVRESSYCLISVPIAV